MPRNHRERYKPHHAAVAGQRRHFQYNRAAGDGRPQATSVANTRFFGPLLMHTCHLVAHRQLPHGEQDYTAHRRPLHERALDHQLFCASELRRREHSSVHHQLHLHHRLPLSKFHAGAQNTVEICGTDVVHQWLHIYIGRAVQDCWQ